MELRGMELRGMELRGMEFRLNSTLLKHFIESFIVTVSKLKLNF